MIKFLKRIFEKVKKMIYKGSNAVEDVYVGGSQIGEVYKGDTLVYQSSKILYAAMSYVPAHSDSGAPTGWADGNGNQNAVRCLTIIKKDGSAKAIPFALYGDSSHLAPTDQQISEASWISGSFSSQYNSGVFNRSTSVWHPAIANGHSSSGAISWSSSLGTRAVTDGTLSTWGWPVRLNGSYTNLMVENYTVTVRGGVCYIYYNNELVKKIRAK